MPVKIELSVAARADLQEIFDYGLGQYGVEAAAAFRASMLEQVKRIAEFPEAYALNEDLNPPGRVSPFSSYVILYRYDGEHVLIVRIRHHAEDWRR